MSFILFWLVTIFPFLRGVVVNDKPVNVVDQDTLARTLWGEARGEGYTGMQAVANVIMNRYKKAQGSVSVARRWGGTVAEICQKPYQFSTWNANDPNLHLVQAVTTADSNFATALDIAKRALQGRLPDLTGGADHYLNIAVTKQIRGGTLPPWADLNKRTASIGSHTFLRLA
tara:strand:+ start:495 stop:1010 length:516 start_codon:yes stop_codon:yes gene_type:complete